MDEKCNAASVWCLRLITADHVPWLTHTFTNREKQVLKRLTKNVLFKFLLYNWTKSIRNCVNIENDYL